MASRKRPAAAAPPAERLESAAHEAVSVARKARKHAKSLSGDNYYGNKLLDLRADAANAFREVSSQSAGDTAALAELIEKVFAPGTKPEVRLAAVRELTLGLKTTWRHAVPAPPAQHKPALFPLTILAQTNRAYLSSIGRQMNGCFDAGHFDACAVMMRRLIELSIIEGFEAKQIAQKIQGAAGNYKQLGDLITAALAEPRIALSRNARTALPKLRDVGNRSAHGRYFNAQEDDIERVRDGCRVVVEEFLHHAGLL